MISFTFWLFSASLFIDIKNLVTVKYSYLKLKTSLAHCLTVSLYPLATGDGLNFSNTMAKNISGHMAPTLLVTQNN